jgi:hypothetical protein
MVKKQQILTKNTSSETRVSSPQDLVTPNATTTTRGSLRERTTHVQGASNYVSWADTADSADDNLTVEVLPQTSSLGNRTPMRLGSTRVWTDVVSNWTTSQARRCTSNIFGNLLNRGAGTSVASQSAHSATLANSDVSAVTTAMVLQLQSQVREL